MGVEPRRSLRCRLDYPHPSPQGGRGTRADRADPVGHDGPRRRRRGGAVEPADAWETHAVIRFLLRSLGFLLLAAAFVGLVLDGARSIANGALSFTSLADVALALAQERWLALRPLVEARLHPMLWSHGLEPLSRAPASILALVVGAAALRLGQPPREPIGHLARR